MWVKRRSAVLSELWHGSSMKTQSSETQSIILVALDRLAPHPHNPRGVVHPASVEELAGSIKEKGILEPLLVAAHPDKAGCFLVVAGHRRRAAAELAGLNTAPVIVRDYSPVEQEEVMLAENLQREALSPLQEARAYQRLVKNGQTQMEVVRKLGLNAARVQSRLVILRLPSEVQRMFDSHELPITLAPLLTRITDLDRQARLEQLVAARRLTVPKLKEMVERIAEAEATDATVEQGRHTRHKERPSSAKTAAAAYTRGNAIADLTRHNGGTLRFTDLLYALENICQHCGMGCFTDICAACPLPQYND